MSELDLTGENLRGAVDIHSHILPGIDDGAVSLEASLEMAAVAARNGTSVMVATPHRRMGARENRPDLILRLTAEVNAALQAHASLAAFRVVAGQEIPLTLNTAEEIAAGAVVTIDGARRYVLVEPPFDMLHTWTAEALHRIVTTGCIPVLAHPERNAAVQAGPQRVTEFVEAGALLQLTAMSVSGDNGFAAKSTAHWIISNGLAGVIASDTHSSTWRPPTVRRAYQAVLERFGAEVAQALCVVNPGKIVAGTQF